MKQNTGWRQRLAQAPRGAKIGLVIAAVVAICGVCGCSSCTGLVVIANILPPLPTPTANAQAALRPTATSGQAGTTTVTASPSSSTPTPSASPSASPTIEATATPNPIIPESSAILGGSVFAFDNKFGNNNCCYLNGWDYQGPYGGMWTGVYAGDSTFDWTSTHRVFGIDNDGGNAGTTWTFAQAKAICGSFLPGDAKYHTTTTVYLGNIVIGIELHYASALLANTLPSSDFKDVNGKPAPTGSVYVYYGYAAGSQDTTVDECALSTDENFAQNPY